MLQRCTSDFPSAGVWVDNDWVFIFYSTVILIRPGLWHHKDKPLKCFPEFVTIFPNKNNSFQNCCSDTLGDWRTVVCYNITTFICIKVWWIYLRRTERRPTMPSPYLRSFMTLTSHFPIWSKLTSFVALMSSPHLKKQKQQLINQLKNWSVWGEPCYCH